MLTKDYLKARRQELGLTLQQVADAVAVSPSTVMRWERGDILNMKSNNVEGLARALNISPLDIVAMSESLVLTDPGAGACETDANMELSELLETLRSREDMRMLFKLAKDATPADVRQAVKIIEALKND